MNLKPCPDCHQPPVVRPLKTVHGLNSNYVSIECNNEECRGLGGIMPRYAFTEEAWNALKPAAET